jgi:hypothetical protein
MEKNLFLVQLRDVSLHNEPHLLPRVQEALVGMVGPLRAAVDRLRSVAAASVPAHKVSSGTPLPFRPGHAPTQGRKLGRRGL